MANIIYTPFRQALLEGAVNLLTADIRGILIDTADYTVSAAHQFLSSVPAAAREEVSAAITGKTTTNGTFDSDDVPFSGTAGDGCEAMILYVHTGSDATARLIGYYDTAAGLPVNLGGDVTIRPNASGWFTL